MSFSTERHLVSQASRSTGLNWRGVELSVVVWPGWPKASWISVWISPHFLGSTQKARGLARERNIEPEVSKAFFMLNSVIHFVCSSCHVSLFVSCLVCPLCGLPSFVGLVPGDLVPGKDCRFVSRLDNLSGWSLACSYLARTPFVSISTPEQEVVA